MNKKLSIPTLLVIGAFLLTSCMTEGYDPAQPTAIQSPSPTFVGEFERTAQAMAIAAEATKQVAQDNMLQLSIQSTQAAVDLAQAEAIQQEFIRQTQAVIDNQSTQQAMQRTSAQSEFNRQATADRSTMEAQQTATQSAIHSTEAAFTLQITQTAVANQQSQVNAAMALTNEAIDINRSVQATELAYEMNDKARKDKAKDMTFYLKTFGLYTLTIVFVVAGIIGARTYLRSKAVKDGTMNWNGKPILVIPNRRGYQIWDPGRALGPGITLNNDGSTGVFGSASSETTQVEVTRRAQAAEFMLASNSGHPATSRRTAMRQAQQIGVQPATAQMPSPQIILLPSPAMQDVVDDVEGQFFIEGEFDADD